MHKTYLKQPALYWVLFFLIIFMPLIINLDLFRSHLYLPAVALIFFIVMLYKIIKYGHKQYKNYTLLHLACFYFVLVFFVYTATYFYDSVFYPEKFIMQEKSVTKALPTNLQDYITQEVTNIVGEKQNVSNKSRIIKVQLIPQIVNNKKAFIAIIDFRANENFTDSLTVYGMIKDANSIMSKIFQDNKCAEIDRITCNTYSDFKDMYGNKKEEIAASFSLARNVANKMTWENITPDMFKNILSKEGLFKLHPALQ